ncbi:MAG: hypothetical protein AWU57_308 [Marinobacter sp. T13-3]|nr:MAG: hypothetical protein AWU57_308 [Marinobacter sp. T13-3]
MHRNNPRTRASGYTPKPPLRWVRVLAGALVLGVTLQVQAAGPPVKQSASGICHPPESSWYDRTQTFTAFDSIEGCLDAGGRLPSGMTLRDLKAQRNPSSDYRPYDRDAFRHWIDEDGDCQDTRAEILIAKSTIRPTFANMQERCRVISGRWVSPFTGQALLNSDDVQIDHVVALKFAWEHGAWRWSGEKRDRFANDPVNLMVVEGSLNGSKGGQGPHQWLPPSGQCGYVARFARIIKLYELSLRPAEARWIDQALTQCGR